MKLQRLYIESYKNLQKLEIDFSAHDGFTLLIGNNGSGKSNLLEFLSFIFYNFYSGKQQYITDFELQYKISSGQSINIVTKKTGILFTVEGSKVTNIGDYLPKRLITIYSGEEERLWKKYYEPIHNAYIDNLNKKVQIDYPKMMYLNRDIWNISLLSLLLSDAKDAKDFISKQLNISKINRVYIDINKRKYQNYINNPVLLFLKKIDSQNSYVSIDEFKTKIKGEFSDDFDDSFNTGYSASEVFYNLYVAYSPPANKRLINEIKIEFNDGLSVESLSEGEKKQLLVKTGLELASSEDTLVLLDEPDAHIHVSNKKQILDVIQHYVNSRHIVISTHSPTLTQSVDEKNLLLLDKGKKDDFFKDKLKAIRHLIGKDSFYNALFGTKDILLVEGKTDKTHIENAYEKLNINYPELEFEIISMNSCSFIKQAMIGLSNSEVNWNKKFIAIFDDDKEGRDSIGKNFKQSTFDTQIKQIMDGNGTPSNEFYAFLLPKPSGHSDDVTIENYYDSSKYEAAFTQALNDKQGYFNLLSIDKISDDLKIKSKTILADMSKDFEIEDFSRYKLIFDQIVKIQSFTPVI